jgi:hypothetical protein
MSSIDHTEIIRLARRGFRAERRGKTIAKIVQLFITDTLIALLKGWLFMLAVAVAHAH